LTLERGWIRLATEHGGVPHHFVTTHLEIQALAPLQASQANELINSVVAGLEGVTIVSGDLNSDPENPGGPSWTPHVRRDDLGRLHGRVAADPRCAEARWLHLPPSFGPP
jgi:endonuclease/exonuclease/phosphatase family metal-dependent hydrolase